MHKSISLLVTCLSLFSCSSNDPASQNTLNLDGGVLEDGGADASLPVECGDGTQNGTETDVDCGGTVCGGCAEGLGCARGSDCSSNVCKVGRCAAPACNDNVKNQDESDSDCGGSTCSACGLGRSCDKSSDCLTNFCDEGNCRESTCGDSVQNGSESDVDCGGGDCNGCSDGQSCVQLSDCISGICDSSVCVSCSDSIKNGSESDVDCGGSACAACANGNACLVGTDCTGGVCDNGTCVSCNDGVKNGLETDKDCGGNDCSPCTPGKTCLLGSDCNSTVCSSNLCTTPTCNDGLLNQDESDVDCGGVCGACDPGKMCNNARDCDSGVCTGNFCQSPTCTDGVANSTETDVDCGGPCDPCADGLACALASDCSSGVCTSSICQVPNCADGVLNGDETSVDCGGNDCVGCGAGAFCRWKSDCASNICESHACVEPVFQSCLHHHLAAEQNNSGTYTVKPGSTSRQVFCDMDNDDGGWTLVSKSLDYTTVGEAATYDNALATYDHTNGSSTRGLWEDMRGVISSLSDIRFTCYKSTTSSISIADPLDVDMSFYSNGWYRLISSNYSSLSINLRNPGPSARRNNLTGSFLSASNAWNNTPNSSGGPRMKQNTVLAVFRIDFDDVGDGGNGTDGTDWGANLNSYVCADTLTSNSNDPMWHIYVREPDSGVPNRCVVNSTTDNSETDVDCGGGNCPLCVQGDDCLVDSDCTSLSCTNNACD